MAKPPQTTPDLSLGNELQGTGESTLVGPWPRVASTTRRATFPVPPARRRLRHGDNLPTERNSSTRSAVASGWPGWTPTPRDRRCRETNVDVASGAFRVPGVRRLAAFLRLHRSPDRWINPTDNANASGFSDMNFGFKMNPHSPEQVLTVQLRTDRQPVIRSGVWGTDNWSVEPAFLFERQLSERITPMAELRDTIPIDANTDFAGQVLRDGIGAGDPAYDSHSVHISPIVEFVGWTVLSGKEFSPLIGDGGIKDAGGDTIVNSKIGVRTTFGTAHDLYVGWGHALTGLVGTMTSSAWNIAISSK